MPENAEKDNGRTAEMERFGINVIRFTNDEVFHNIDGIITEIRRRTTPGPAKDI